MNNESTSGIRSSVRFASALGSRQRQSGVVMAVSLILLLVITLIAVSSMRGTMLEEKMAGNSLDRNLAFQSTESAIREAEISIEGVASLGGFDGSAGLFGLADAEPDFANSATWINANQSVVAVDAFGAYAEPQYYVKHFTTVVGTEGALNMSGYGDNKGTGDVTVFKITARGTGGNSDSAEVILRTYYGRIF
jgi:type IV pilus assembly protein PilX